MTSADTKRRSPSGKWRLSPQARSTTRLALVACALLGTMGVLAIVTFQARDAERALEAAAAHSLRDYAGYAGRILGSDVLRRFAEQRAAILAPVTGASLRPVPAPALDDVIARGNRALAGTKLRGDSGSGYFRLDLATGAIEGRGVVTGEFARRLADTLVHVAALAPTSAEPDIFVMMDGDRQQSVAFARLLNPAGQATALYGYTYARALGIAVMAQRTFNETPLLPTSFAGARWNYDTTRVQSGEVVNDSLLGARITDRAGHVMWESATVGATDESAFRERVVLSTLAGGIVVEVALRPAREASLIPTVVRDAQRTSLWALLALSVALAAVALYTLRRERLGARERRSEAMQELALGLRHELNNALASVMLNAELLGEEDLMDEGQRERLAAIVEQAERMRSVLRHLEKRDRLDVVVPYLNEGFMVDLSAAGSRKPQG